VTNHQYYMLTKNRKKSTQQISMDDNYGINLGGYLHTYI